MVAFLAADLSPTAPHDTIAPERENLADADLVALSRAGDVHAYAVLFRRHRQVATRLALRIAPSADADDIVADSFSLILGQVRRGRGPNEAFRAYLMTTVRHEAGRRLKARDRVRPTDDDAMIDTHVPFVDSVSERFESSTIGAAYRALPERWRQVLWLIDIEGRRPHEVADDLGLAPNAVSALAYRARVKLRETYVQQHIQVPTDVDRRCRETREVAARHLLGALAARDTKRVESHLARCGDCAQVFSEIAEFGMTPESLRISSVLLQR